MSRPQRLTASPFDRTGAVLATDGEVMPDVRKVADKLGIHILIPPRRVQRTGIVP